MALTVQKTDEPRIVRNWPVLVHTAEDGGKVRKDEIQADYEVLPQSEVDDIMRSAQQAGDNPDTQILRRTVKAINGMVDADNSPLPFDEALAVALDSSNIRVAMVGAFFDVQAGRKPARKN